jgi:hypothetical protein
MIVRDCDCDCGRGRGRGGAETAGGEKAQDLRSVSRPDFSEIGQGRPISPKSASLDSQARSECLRGMRPPLFFVAAGDVPLISSTNFLRRCDSSLEADRREMRKARRGRPANGSPLTPISEKSGDVGRFLRNRRHWTPKRGPSVYEGNALTCSSSPQATFRQFRAPISCADVIHHWGRIDERRRKARRGRPANGSWVCDRAIQF